ncbi:hypothetical protein NVV95_06645 [Herbiconiux sp. CPCC 205716]|uniref:Uncharacterized protein n=1 Tax=Herbiconiux gentiana TaxID=2970912 RepID=A0ABT2GDG7_9MICO|nr:hypothetical protein [Herbiconiux gentiana]MCS5714230.1 hypothetical protein [Herbiconiux gentiana]
MVEPGSASVPSPGYAPASPDDMGQLIAAGETEVTDRPGVRAAQAGISLGVLLAIVVPAAALVLGAALTAIVASVSLWIPGLVLGVVGAP